jgi:hypothetical protein
LQSSYTRFAFVIRAALSPSHSTIYLSVLQTVSSEAKDLIASLLTVDAAERLTAEQALENGWILGDDAQLETRDLGVNLQKFKTFNARRKFRAAVSTIIAINKMSSLAEEFFTPMSSTVVQEVVEMEKVKSMRTLS